MQERTPQQTSLQLLHSCHQQIKLKENTLKTPEMMLGSSEISYENTIFINEKVCPPPKLEWPGDVEG